MIRGNAQIEELEHRGVAEGERSYNEVLIQGHIGEDFSAEQPPSCRCSEEKKRSFCMQQQGLAIRPAQECPAGPVAASLRHPINSAIGFIFLT